MIIKLLWLLVFILLYVALGNNPYEEEENDKEKEF